MKKISTKYTQVYVEPSIKVVNFSFEGMICTSLTLANEDYDEGDVTTLDLSLF